MKKLTFLLLNVVFVFAGTFFTSCGDDKPGDEREDTLSVAPLNHTFEASDETSQEFKVTKSADKYSVALANSADSWVKIDEKDAAFFVTVDDYTDETATSNREAKITVKSGNAPDVTVTIYQKPPTVVEELEDMKLGQSSLDFEAEENLTQSVVLTTKIEDKDIDIKISDNWITSAVINEGKLVVTVSKNEEDKRDGKVTLSSVKAKEDAVLIVNQEAAPVEEDLVLAGTWKMEGKFKIYDGFTGIVRDMDPISETVEITYDDEKDVYLLPFEFDFEYMSMSFSTDLYLDFDEENETVTFKNAVELPGSADMGFSGTYYYYNYISLTNEPQDNKTPADYSLEFEVSSNKKTLSVPETTIYNDAHVYQHIGFALGADLLDITQYTPLVIAMINSLTLTKE